MDARIAGYLRATFVGFVKRVLTLRYDSNRAAFFAAALTLFVGAGGARVAMQTALQNYMLGYLKTTAAKKAGVEPQYLIFNFCYATAKTFFYCYRRNGVASFRFDARRIFRVASEKVRASRSTTLATRERQATLGGALNKAGENFPHMHNARDAHGKSGGFDFALAVAL